MDERGHCGYSRQEKEQKGKQGALQMPVVDIRVIGLIFQLYPTSRHPMTYASFVIEQIRKVSSGP